MCSLLWYILTINRCRAKWNEGIWQARRGISSFSWRSHGTKRANCALGHIKLKLLCFRSPMRNLLSSMAVFVLCDRQMQGTHWAWVSTSASGTRANTTAPTSPWKESNVLFGSFTFCLAILMQWENESTAYEQGNFCNLLTSLTTWGKPSNFCRNWLN